MNKTIAGISIQEIVQRHSDMLIRIAFNNVKSMGDAEDIVQEVYIKLMTSSQTLKTEEHLKAWLIRVTINKFRDYFRSAWFKRSQPLSEAAHFIAPEHHQVMTEIFSLKREDRNIIHLFYYEGYTIKEIASLLKQKENTVSSKLQRARKKLKHIIEEGSIL